MEEDGGLALEAGVSRCQRLEEEGDREGGWSGGVSPVPLSPSGEAWHWDSWVAATQEGVERACVREASEVAVGLRGEARIN